MNQKSIEYGYGGAGNVQRPKLPLPKLDKPPRRHVCKECHESFSRSEHLQRHERSHTNEKPFACTTCERAFSRRDLMLRHERKMHTPVDNLFRTPDQNQHSVQTEDTTEEDVPADEVSSIESPNGTPRLDESIESNRFNPGLVNRASQPEISRALQRDTTFDHAQSLPPFHSVGATKITRHGLSKNSFLDHSPESTFCYRSKIPAAFAQPDIE